jgi:DNA-binding MarR family transcriptional regulator
MSAASPIPVPRNGRRAHNGDRPQERAFRTLVRTFGLMERVMQPYFARFGISGSQWGVLRTLQRTDGEGVDGLRITDLSERLLIRPPSVTGVVDRLERGGLVVRDAATDDLRSKRVRLTARGRRLVEQVLAVHGDQVDTLLGGLNATDQSELHRLLDRMSSHLEKLLEQPPASVG